MGYNSVFHLTWENGPDWFNIDHVVDVLLEQDVKRKYSTAREIDDNLVVKQFNDTFNLNTGKSSDYVLEGEIFQSAECNRHELIRLANHITAKLGYDDREIRRRSIIYHMLNGDSGKWYDYQEDMKAVSNKYPSITFILDRKGENPDDLEKSYYKFGKSEVIKAEITYREPTL